jgi:hypothetical protein
MNKEIPMNWLKNKFDTITAYFNSKYPFPDEGPCATDYEEDYGSLKVVELKALAKERGLRGYTGLKKAQLVELLNQN